MYNNKWIINATFSIVLSVSGVAMGHAQQAPTPAKPIYNHAISGSRATPLILTPAQLAAWKEQIRLNEASAAALDTGQYAEAEDDARQALSMGYNTGMAQELLASALNAGGKTQEALQAYKVMSDEGDVFPRNQLPYALLLLKTGQWAEAVAAYNKQLPYLAEGKHLNANSHFSPNEPQPKDLETAIHIALGLTYDSAASWGGHSQADKANSEYKKAIAVEPNSALANLYYGLMLRQSGQKAQAQAAFAKAAKTGSDDVKATAKEDRYSLTT